MLSEELHEYFPSTGYIAFGQGENSIKTGPKQPNSAENSRSRLFWTSFDSIFHKKLPRSTDVQSEGGVGEQLCTGVQ